MLSKLGEFLPNCNKKSENLGARLISWSQHGPQHVKQRKKTKYSWLLDVIGILFKSAFQNSGSFDRMIREKILCIKISLTHKELKQQK